MFTKYYWGDHMENIEMGWTCGTYGWRNDGRETQQKGKKIGIHKRVGWEDVSWTNLAQDRDG